jgi:putative peptidoglycan lipid II flippase
MRLKENILAKKKIFSSSIWVTFFTTLSFIGFFVRDYLMAKLVGFGSSLDSFYLAMMLPMFFVSIFCIPFGHAAVPKLEKIRKLDRLKFYKSVKYFSFIAIISCSILCLFTYFFSDNLFSLLHYIGWIKQEGISNLMLLMVLPILFLSGLVILANSLLLVNGHYIFPTLAQLIVPIFAIVFLIIFGPKYGVNAVILGMLLGQIANFTLINRFLNKGGVHLFPLNLKSTISDKKHFWGGYFNLVVIAIFTSSAILINTLLASSLGGGAVSIYNLGSKVSLFAIGVLTSIFTSILLPYFSRLACYFDRNLLNQETSNLIIFGSVLSIPFSLIIFLYSEPIAAFIFSNISSENSTILGIASVLKYSIIQLPFWITNSIVLRHANAISKIQVISLIAVIAFLINLFLGLFLIELMNVGGVALASTISVAVSSGLMLFYYLQKKIINLFDFIFIGFAWINFTLIVLAEKFNFFFVQLIAILLLVIILIFKSKELLIYFNNKVSS